jgi:hypothetical protein
MYVCRFAIRLCNRVSSAERAVIAAEVHIDLSEYFAVVLVGNSIGLSSG